LKTDVATLLAPRLYNVVLSSPRRDRGRMRFGEALNDTGEATPLAGVSSLLGRGKATLQ
jgi:hypothetical protein